MDFKGLSTRTLTALGLIAGAGVVLLAAEIFCYGRWLAVLTGAVMVTLCAVEFASICSRGVQTKKLAYFLTLTFPAVVYLCITFSFGVCGLLNSQALGLAIVVIAAVLLSFLVAAMLIISAGSRDLEASVDWSRELLLGVHLIGFGGAALMSLLLFEDHAVRMILWLIVVVSINDTAAYIFGTKIGGPRLAPVISPNKTISGSAAGVICGCAAGLLFWFLLPFAVSYAMALAITFLTVAAAQIGDLMKSYIKRLHAVKDSGNILPGHGGLLDRIDGILAAAPVVLFYFLLMSLL